MQIIILIHIQNKRELTKFISFSLSYHHSSSNPKSSLLTNTTSIAQCQSDIPILSPSDTPWVLDSPGCCAHSDQVNIMVDFIWGASVIDSGLVGGPGLSVDGNGHWGLVEVGLNLVTAVWFQDVEIDLVCARGVLALALCALVWVAGLKDQTLLLGEFQSTGSAATAASESGIISWTVDDLLLWQQCALVFHQQSCLDQTGAAKGVSGVACSLVLDGRHLAQHVPVDVTQVLAAHLLWLFFHWNSQMFPFLHSCG